MKDPKDDKKNIIKLEDIPKQEVFTNPKEYFDELPMIIHARLSETKREKASFGIPILAKIAVPALMLLLVLLWLGSPTPSQNNVQAILDQVSTEEMIAFIEDSDLSTEDLIAMVDLDQEDIDAIETDEINLLTDDEWNQVMNEYDYLDLNDSL